MEERSVWRHNNGRKKGSKGEKLMEENRRLEGENKSKDDYFFKHTSNSCRFSFW